MSHSTPLVRPVNDVIAYEVHNNGEYGTFYVEHGSGENNNWVSLTAQTSFGNVGHTWPNIGRRQWYEFLGSTNNFLKKLFGEAAEEFDPVATLKALIQAWETGTDENEDGDDGTGKEISDAVIKAATELMDYFDGSTLQELAEALEDHSGLTWGEGDASDLQDAAIDYLANYAETRKSDAAQGFEEKLWPHFIAAAEADAVAQVDDQKSDGRPRQR